MVPIQEYTRSRFGFRALANYTSHDLAFYVEYAKKGITVVVS